MIPPRSTRTVRIGRIAIGSGHPIAVQSMTATKTQDVEATVVQVLDLERAGADVVRIAVDSTRDAEALEQLGRKSPPPGRKSPARTGFSDYFRTGSILSLRARAALS